LKVIFISNFSMRWSGPVPFSSRAAGAVVRSSFVLLRHGVLASAAFVGLALATGCGAGAGVDAPPAAPEAEAAPPHIAMVLRSKCASCHVQARPGRISHEKLEAAMQRHRRRAKLTESEWSELVDFLAADNSSVQPRSGETREVSP
jgi:hypothetical protein